MTPTKQKFTPFADFTERKMSKVINHTQREESMLLDAFQPKPLSDMSSIASVYGTDDTFA